MTKKQAINILVNTNKWRRANDNKHKMPPPYLIGNAIDTAVMFLKETFTADEVKKQKIRLLKDVQNACMGDEDYTSYMCDLFIQDLQGIKRETNKFSFDDFIKIIEEEVSKMNIGGNNE